MTIPTPSASTRKLRSLPVALLGFLFSIVSALAEDTEVQVQQAQGSPLVGLFGFLIAIVIIVAAWKIFTKAGEPGWASIIPIYNVIVLLKICGKPLWWIILMIIPFVNFVVAIMLAISLAKAFGKGAGFGIGLAFLPFIFYPILGFGDATYVGPKAA